MTLQLRRENGHEFSYVHYMLFSTSFEEIAVAFKLGMKPEKHSLWGRRSTVSISRGFSFLSWRLILKGIELSWVPLASDELSDWSIRRDTFRSCPTQAQQLYSTQPWKKRHFNCDISGQTNLHTLPTNRLYICFAYLFIFSSHGFSPGVNLASVLLQKVAVDWKLSRLLFFIWRRSIKEPR